MELKGLKKPEKLLESPGLPTNTKPDETILLQNACMQVTLQLTYFYTLTHNVSTKECS
tara:strand:+ start:1108 stop:1281 length:174 start_codon:yes stop_codon:yes gene_type:complete